MIVTCRPPLSLSRDQFGTIACTFIFMGKHYKSAFCGSVEYLMLGELGCCARKAYW